LIYVWKVFFLVLEITSSSLFTGWFYSAHFIFLSPSLCSSFFLYYVSYHLYTYIYISVHQDHTALILASMNGHVEVVRVLLAVAEIDVNYRTNQVKVFLFERWDIYILRFVYWFCELIQRWLIVLKMLLPSSFFLPQILRLDDILFLITPKQ
jgi:hypothetical protein